jgi:hypothetical protein
MMDFKINQNKSAYAGESTTKEAVDYGDTFEDLAEVQLFEDLAQGEGGEGGDSAEADGGGETSSDTDSGSAGSGGGDHPGQGSSDGQQRLLDYWSAQQELEAEGVTGVDAGSGRGSEAATLNGVPMLALTAEEAEELERASENFSALSFLEEDDTLSTATEVPVEAIETDATEIVAQPLPQQVALRNEAIRLMQADELLAHFLAQQDEARQEQRRQDLLNQLQQFQQQVNGLTQMAGQQSFTGAMMFMGLGGGAFALSPTVDRRGLMLEKPKETLKGPGGKSESKKAQTPEIIDPEAQAEMDEIAYKMAVVEDDLSLSHDDLMAFRKEAFRERFGRWLAERDDAIGEEDDQMFIAHMLQTFDQFKLSAVDHSAAVHALWINAMALLSPPNLLKVCEAVLAEPLPALREQLLRFTQRESVVSQGSDDALQFDSPFLEAVSEVTGQLVQSNPEHWVAQSQADIFAISANRMKLPLVVVEFDGSSYRLLTPCMAPGQPMWGELQVWDIDWQNQSTLLLLEGDQFRFLRRQF